MELMNETQIQFQLESIQDFSNVRQLLENIISRNIY
jgi:hypothetical protein